MALTALSQGVNARHHVVIHGSSYPELSVGNALRCSKCVEMKSDVVVALKDRSEICRRCCEVDEPEERVT